MKFRFYPPGHDKPEPPEVRSFWDEMRKEGFYNPFTSKRCAYMLRIGMANSIECPDRKCKRQHMCVRPPLQCYMRAHADVYDWD